MVLFCTFESSMKLEMFIVLFYGEVAEANTPEVGYYSSSGAFSQDYATWVGCTTGWRVLLDRQQMCVLSYIANKEKSSIITTMHEESRPYQWNHVDTGFNPADALKSSSTKSAGPMALPHGGKQRTAGLRNLKFPCDKEVSTVEADFLTRMVQSCSRSIGLRSWWHGRYATVPIFCASVADGKKAQLKYSSPENPVPSV